VNDAAVDRRLQRKYGITLVEYNQILAKQGGKCAICGRPPGDRRLAVDHEHRFKYIKITVIKHPIAGWDVWSNMRFLMAVSGKTKKDAILEARKIIMKKSIRGLLCYRCNTSLGKLTRKGNENPKWLRAAAKYLEDFDDRHNINKK